MAITISIINHKGGVGKTTTTMSIAKELANRHYKVLMIDMDAQCNLTGLAKCTQAPTLYEAMIGNDDLPIYNVCDNLDVVPSSIDVLILPQILHDNFNDVDIENHFLKKKIRRIKDQYQYILIDCPPSIGTMQYNALMASDDVIIPMTAEPLPQRGFSTMVDVVKMVRQVNKTIRVLGVLITRYNRRRINKAVEDSLRDTYGDLIFATRIRENTDLMEFPLYTTNIFDYNPESNGAKDYRSLVDEMTIRLQK